MFKILLNTFDRQDLLDEGLVSYLVGSLSDLFCVSPLCVDLPKPTGIPITRRPNQDFWMEITEEKLIQVGVQGGLQGVFQSFSMPNV